MELSAKKFTAAQAANTNAKFQLNTVILGLTDAMDDHSPVYNAWPRGVPVRSPVIDHRRPFGVLPSDSDP